MRQSPCDKPYGRVGPSTGLALLATAVKLEILYFDGCPNHQQVLPMLRELAAEHGADLEQRPVETAEDAEQAGFLGSPSIRVDGRDVEPGAERRTDFGLKCRLYRSAGGQSGVPPREWVERALQATAGR